MACNLAEFRCQIDSGYSASKVISEVACGPADSASNVQKMVRRTSFHQAGDFHSRLQAATMELIVRCERFLGRTIRIDAVVLKCRFKTCKKLASTVVSRDVGRVHRVPLCPNIVNDQYPRARST